MKIFEYANLDVSKVKRQYEKTISFLGKDDFRSTDVKKLAEQNLYRSKLDDANHLLFSIMYSNVNRYAFILEIPGDHGKSRQQPAHTAVCGVDRIG